MLFGFDLKVARATEKILQFNILVAQLLAAPCRVGAVKRSLAGAAPSTRVSGLAVGQAFLGGAMKKCRCPESPKLTQSLLTWPGAAKFLQWRQRYFVVCQRTDEISLAKRAERLARTKVVGL